jgi:hypothetical protein
VDHLPEPDRTQVLRDAPSVVVAPRQRALYPRWILANAAGELLGLGATFASIAAIMPSIEGSRGPSGLLVGFAVLVLTGVLEATVVALLQHRAMRPWLPRLSVGTWWRATLIGALIAYALGYLPSTLMDAAGGASGGASSEPPVWIVLPLAAILGAVAGAILSLFQALALRRHVPHAGAWIPANMIAWAIGMPIIFFAIDRALVLSASWQTVSVLGAGLLVSGATVGTVHGRTLVRLLRA